VSATELQGRYPKGAIDTTIATLEAVRPDYPAGGAIRRSIDDALDRLYRFREIETGADHPYRLSGAAVEGSET
jgi:hypothetical protein